MLNLYDTTSSQAQEAFTLAKQKMAESGKDLTDAEASDITCTDNPQKQKAKSKKQKAKSKKDSQISDSMSRFFFLFLFLFISFFFQ